jgi:hypothetical protein
LLLQDMCIVLELRDATLLVPSLKKVAAVAAAIPSVEAFVAQVNLQLLTHTSPGHHVNVCYFLANAHRLAHMLGAHQAWHMQCSPACCRFGVQSWLPTACLLPPNSASAQARGTHCLLLTPLHPLVALPASTHMPASPLLFPASLQVCEVVLREGLGFMPPDFAFTQA